MKIKITCQFSLIITIVKEKSPFVPPREFEKLFVADLVVLKEQLIKDKIIIN